MVWVGLLTDTVDMTVTLLVGKFQEVLDLVTAFPGGLSQGHSSFHLHGVGRSPFDMVDTASGIVPERVGPSHSLGPEAYGKSA